MKKMILTAVFVALASLLFASGCNTVRGMGQDLEQGGRQLQEVSTR